MRPSPSRIWSEPNLSAPSKHSSPTFETVIEDIRTELSRARIKWPAFHSSHEGFAVLKEEVDEGWDAIRSNRFAHAKIEAVQVAAMAIRFILDNESEI